MIRALLAAIVLLSPVQAHAQGAILETLADLKNTQRAAGIPQRASGTRAEVANVPPPREQLATSTCTSWSVTYAAASQAARRNGLGAGVTLSPAYTYNQVSGDRACHSRTSISKTLELLREHGALPIEEFVFDPGWCGRPADRGRAQARAALSHQGLEPLRGRPISKP